MKKFISKLVGFIGALFLVFTLVGCDKSGAITKAYENAEYKIEVVNSENELVKPILDTLSEEDRKEASKWEFIMAVKGLNTAIVVKFPSTSSLKNALTAENEDGSTNTEVYDKALEAGLINGNCWFAFGSPAAKDVFKGA